MEEWFVPGKNSVVIVREDGRLVLSRFKDVKKGDVFLLVEVEDSVLHVGGAGILWVATRDALLDRLTACDGGGLTYRIEAVRKEQS